MDLIEKYLGESEMNEINGRGRATPLRAVKQKDFKKVKDLLKKMKVPYEEYQGQLIIGDDDFDEVEEQLVRKFGIF
jgi:hypothetical protein